MCFEKMLAFVHSTYQSFKQFNSVHRLNIRLIRGWQYFLLTNKNFEYDIFTNLKVTSHLFKNSKKQSTVRFMNFLCVVYLLKVFVEKAVEDGVGAHHEHGGEVNPGEHNHHSLLVLTNLCRKLLNEFYRNQILPEFLPELEIYN